jgi:hypothetical protein
MNFERSSSPLRTSMLLGTAPIRSDSTARSLISWCVFTSLRNPLVLWKQKVVIVDIKLSGTCFRWPALLFFFLQDNDLQALPSLLVAV